MSDHINRAAAVVLPEGYVAPWRPHPNPMMKGVIVDSSVPHPKEVATAPDALIPLICALPDLLPNADSSNIDRDRPAPLAALGVASHLRTTA